MREWMFVLLVVTLLILRQHVSGLVYSPDNSLVDSVNANSSARWKAGASKFDGWTAEAVENMLGVSLLSMYSKMASAGRLRRSRPLRAGGGGGASSLPESFDPRTKWPECAEVLGEIRDQGSCGSCWAFGAVEAMSDRICIQSGGRERAHLSAQDLVACCGTCGLGCFGGFPESAWQYWITNGIVTGGNYNSSEGCVPYSIPACEHHREGGQRPACGDIMATPKCVKRCVRRDESESAETEYAKDKHYGQGKVDYTCFEDEIMQELYRNGPVEAAMTVYNDFLTYQSGVYHHIAGGELGGHAIRLLGWGVTDKGDRYWLAANSWNTDWGEDGFFRIRRGTDECGIESYIVFAKARLSGEHSQGSGKEPVTLNVYLSTGAVIYKWIPPMYNLVFVHLLLCFFVPVMILLLLYRSFLLRTTAKKGGYVPI